MNTYRRSATIIGVLYIIGTAAGVLSVVVTMPILSAPDKLAAIVADGNRLVIGARLWPTAFFDARAAAPGAIMSGGMMGSQEQMDRLFLEMMIPHHEAAISMAEQALDESQRPEIRSLAEAIISSQTAEIAEMRGYLRDFFGVTNP